MEYVYIIAGFVLLLFGGDYLVKGASGLALKLDVSPMLVGITVVALGTSAPELVVSLSAALKGKPDIAVGNVVGSNIANVALILGFTALLFPIRIKRRTLRLDWIVLMAASILFIALGQNGLLNRWEGALSVGLMTAYISVSYVMERRSDDPQFGSDGVDTKEASRHIALLLFFIIAGSVALVFGAQWLVEGAEILARSFGVSDRVIAITLVSFGTSVPELAASIIAAFKGQKDLSLGNIIGSNLYNLLAVLGITSLVKPIHIAPEIVNVDMWWMLATSFAILPIGIIGMKIGRIGGILLFLAYVCYIALVLIPAS